MTEQRQASGVPLSSLDREKDEGLQLLSTLVRNVSYNHKGGGGFIMLISEVLSLLLSGAACGKRARLLLSPDWLDWGGGSQPSGRRVVITVLISLSSKGCPRGIMDPTELTSGM